MTISMSTIMINRMIDAQAALYTDGSLEIRTGSRPANANLAATGTLIVRIRLPLIPWANAIGGAAAISGDWYATAIASGTAGWWRLADALGTGRRDGSVSLAGGGGDLILNKLAIPLGEVVQVTSLDLTLDGWS